MAENVTEVLTGAAVLAVAVGFLAYAGQTTGLSGSANTYELKASFRSVEGITLGSDVRLAGVKVGTVTALTLNPVTYFADASVSVPQGIDLPDDSAILVSSEGLLGGAFIEILPGGSLTNFAAGDEIEDTQGAVSVVSLLMKFADSSAATPAPTATPDAAPTAVPDAATVPDPGATVAPAE